MIIKTLFITLHRLCVLYFILGYISTFIYYNISQITFYTKCYFTIRIQKIPELIPVQIIICAVLFQDSYHISKGIQISATAGYIYKVNNCLLWTLNNTYVGPVSRISYDHMIRFDMIFVDKRIKNTSYQ